MPNQDIIDKSGNNPGMDTFLGNGEATILITDPRGLGYWFIPLAGFVSPKYVMSQALTPDDDRGFYIGDAAAVVISFENGSTSTVVHEQTLDPKGQTGWFPIGGKISQGGSALTSSGSANNNAYDFPAIGIRHRIRVTALTVADLRVRIGKMEFLTDVSPGSTSITSTISEGSASTGGSALGIALQAKSTQKTTVADAQLVQAQGTLDGKQIIKPYAIPQLEWAYAAASGGVVTAVSTTFKGAATLKNYMVTAQITNGGVTGSEVAIRDGAGGTVLWRGFVPPNSSISPHFHDPLAGSSATLMEFQVVTAGAAIYFNAQGYTGP